MKQLKILVILLISIIPPTGHALFDGKDSTMLLQSEKNTIEIFKNNVQSVVNVTNIRLAKRGWFFDFDITEIPAGAGSGFVWDDKGHIVTNYHVVANGDTFLVAFHKDKKQYKAKIVGAEPSKDIAILKLEEMPKELHPITIGTSKGLQVGQKALAIGNPFGLDHTITQGIISALERKIEGIARVKIHGMIQTDCSINPGNSGGPLLDSSGRLIGMNTMIFSHSGSSAGVGFAVPVDTIKRLAPQIIKYGKIKRPALGIGLVEDHIRSHFGIEKGIIVKSVVKGGPAASAGLEGITRDPYGRYFIGDIILEVDGEEVNSYDDIFHVLDKRKIGDVVNIKFERNNKIRQTKITLQELQQP